GERIQESDGREGPFRADLRDYFPAIRRREKRARSHPRVARCDEEELAAACHFDVLRSAMLVFRRAIAVTAFAATTALSPVCGAQFVAPPPAGKLYQGLYFDEPAAESDPTEHDVIAENVPRF